jgi:bifunctional ADP-heptose synthase (sugar kinase/adenylyltransferase)
LTDPKFREVEKWVERAAELNVVALGERILDAYVYVSPAGKSPKENVITYVRNGSDEWAGGIEVIAAHLRQSCGQAGIPAAIQAQPPVVKRRWVERAFVAKVFSEAEMPKYEPFTLPLPTITDADFILAADFGHGLFDKLLIEQVRETGKWLALTVQANSLNYGFNVASRWPGAEYVALDEQELRLAAASPTGDIETLMSEGWAAGIKTLAVTSGHLGCMIRRGEDVAFYPALEARAVDRLGAGDAFFAWTAPLVYLEAPLGIVGLVGSAAAAIHVSNTGNHAAGAGAVLSRIWEVLDA